MSHKTKTQHKIIRALEYGVLWVLLVLTLLWSLLTNSAHAQVSTLHNNCLGTGGLSAGLTTFLNSKFVSNWPTQNKCQWDIAVTVTAAWDLLSGNVMRYDVTVTNNWPRWSYSSVVAATFNNGLTTSTPTLAYGQMGPGTSQTQSLYVTKTASTPTTSTTATSTFTLTDSTITDTNTSNNTRTHSPVVRWSTRAVCRASGLTVPSYECDALMDLYTSTNGAWWTSKTNWSISPNIESWFGLTTTQDDDLLAYYSFDASNATDDAGNGRNGALVSSPSFSAGVLWNAANLNWTSYINLGSSINAWVSTSAWFTINTWVNTSVTSAQNLFSVVNGETNNFILLRKDEWNPDFRVRINGVDTVAIWFNTEIRSGKWVMVTATYIPGWAVRLYVDGVLDNSATAAWSNLNLWTIPALIWRDGRLWGNPAFNGSIDEVRIYNRAISAAEVTQLYQKNTIIENVQSLCLSNTVESTACNYQYQWTAGNNMSGPLPASIGLLSEITTLSLNNNALGGVFPTELTNLKKAWRVLLASTNLTWSLPTTIGNMSALAQFDIAGNNLGGAIPSELANTSINTLWATNNKFTSLPDLSARNWSQLQIENNLLSWSLPSWIGTEAGITFLRLSKNNFTGPIPSSWSGLTSLTTLWLWDNQLTWSLDVFSGMNVWAWQQLRVENNNFNRDHNNNAIVPANIQARLSSMTTQNLTNQWDITPSVIQYPLPLTAVNFNGKPIATPTVTGPYGTAVQVAQYGNSPHHVFYSNGIGWWASNIHTVPVANGETYTLGFWVRTTAGTRSITPRITENVNDRMSTFWSTTIDTNWKYIAIDHTYASVGAEPRFFIDKTDSCSGASCADIQVFGANVTRNALIPQTIDGAFTYDLLVNENSSTTWAGFANGLTISFAGPSICQQALLTTDKILNRNGTTTIQVAALEPVRYEWCQIYVTDRAWLQSNRITLPTFTSNEYGICNTVTDITKSDCKALIDLYYATNGSWWTNKTNRRGKNGTVAESTPTTACDWFGVQCSGWRVSWMCQNASGSVCYGGWEIQWNNLVGELPQSLSNLTGLVSLMVQNNFLTGNMPNIAVLPVLANIYVQWASNNIWWPLPDLPPSAINIYLQNNQFTGPFPQSYCNIIDVFQLFIDNNPLNTTLPTCLPNFRNNAFFWVRGAWLIGTIPSSWQSSTIWYIYLNDNNLTWPIPSSWWLLTNLKSLYLHNNNLQWFIPDSLRNLPSLTNNWSYLNNNCLSPSTTYMSAGLVSTLNSKFNNWSTQKTCPGTIWSRVWTDTNTNWLRDSTETWPSGVTVTLRACTDQTPVVDSLRNWLLAQYTFDNWLTTDSGPWWYTASNSGGVTAVAGKVGSAAQFNGSNTINVWNLWSSNAWTISFWMSSDDVANYRNPLHTNFLWSTTNNQWIRFEQYAGWSLLVWANNINVWNSYIITNWVAVNNRYHVVITVDKQTSSLKTYFNNTLANSVTTNSIPTSIENLVLWAWYSNDANRFYRGKLDDVRIYDRTLSASEITALYNITTPTTATNIPISYAGTSVSSTSSNAGAYSFASVNPGRYYLEYSNIPVGFKFTTQGIWWLANNLNSDVNPWSAKTPCFELYNGLSELTVDAWLINLPYSSCETAVPAYTPVLVWQAVAVSVAWYGQNGTLSISSTGNANTWLNRNYLSQTLTNQWSNRALKTWSTTFTPTAGITYTITWWVDGFTDRLEYYQTVTSNQAYRVIGEWQWCAVQNNLWPITLSLNTINQIATIPAPISYCTGWQAGLPYAATNNQPPKMLVKVPACTSTMIATTDANLMCDNVTDMTPAECKELVKLYDASEWWIQCATQNNFCSFAGTREVRYGAWWAYRYLTRTNGASCNDSTFGNPGDGITKQCRYKMDAGTWTNETKWRFIADSTPRTACDWYGISCAGWKVSSINLSSNNLQKTLAWVNWWVFSSLTNLELYSNNLWWSLPDISTIPTLTTLRLWSNQFTGSLPLSWSAAPVLSDLNLADAGQFTGTVPSTWTSLSDTLTKLHLGSILVDTGAMPTVISSMTKLTELYLYDNKFTGALATQFSSMTGLKTLQLQSNLLYGNLQTIPLPQLTTLYTSTFGGNKSALDNNCLYTGAVSGTTGTFLNARFNFTSLPVTNWRTQNYCDTDIELSTIAKVGNLMTGLTMTYIINYKNLWDIPAYAPTLAISLHSGLYLMSWSANIATGSRPYIVSLPQLLPGQTGQYSFVINKMGLGSGFHSIVNQFSVTDSYIADINPANNNFTDVDNARGSSYAVCVNPAITIQTYECESLWDLYTSTNGALWTTKTNWMTSPDVDTWHGITLTSLSGVNYVQKICMATATDSTACQDSWLAGTVGNNLSWSLPFTLWDLSQLTELRVPTNKISWVIPAAFGNLDKLITLVLHNNKITSIGTGVGGMAELLRLQLGSNPLITIDASISNAPKLNDLAFESTNITSLPNLTSMCDTLVNLSIQQNTGLINVTLPTWLPWCTKLQTLNARSAWLTGAITNQFAMPSLQYLRLHDNNLVGELPTSLSTWLIDLTLHNNKFTGTLPTQWSSLTKLETLRLDANTGISSTLPTQWSTVNKLKILNLSGASIQWQIPTSWASMTQMRELIIPNTQLDGPLPIATLQAWPSLNTGPITSTINNNCLYTGLLTTPQVSWMNTFLSWQTQRKCDADLQITLASKSAPDYNPGKTIVYTISYANNWPRWSYEPVINVVLNTGVFLSGTTSTTTWIRLPMLAPGQTWQVLITANKRGTGQGTGLYTNLFVITDPATVDAATGNNTLTDTGVIKWFKYNECIDITDVPQVECEALMDLYTYTAGASWTTKTNWAGLWDATQATLCDWYGVTCTSGRVTNLCLAWSTPATQCLNAWSSPWGNNLSWSLQITMGDLTELTGLFLGANKLSWPIPLQVNQLVKLSNLSLWENQFTTLPNLTGLQQLQWLHLHNNQFTAALPTWIAQMPNLSWLTLYQNQFTGPLPPSWTGARNLWYLSISDNPTLAWSSLPTQRSTWSSLRELYINNNALGGSLPTSWSSLSWITRLWLYNNSIVGTLPSTWTGMRSLQIVYLWINSLTGSLPTSWSSMTGLKDLRLNNNNFTGTTLPASWSALTNLEYLDVAWSNLIGTLPSSRWSLNKIKTIRINSNKFVDDIPSSWFTGMSAMQNFIAFDNDLGWPIIPSRQNWWNLAVNGADSVISNNCLYTGSVVWGYLSWMDTYFGAQQIKPASSWAPQYYWQNQRRCPADLQLTGLVVTGNLYTGAFMTYTFQYENKGVSRAYNPTVSVVLHSGLSLLSGGRSMSISLWYLRPYASWQITIPIMKTWVGSGTEIFTNTFAISDTASDDLITTNNIITHTWVVKWFKYAICGIVQDISQPECEALGDFYTDLGGTWWTNRTYWMGISDPTDTTACDWFGVTCIASTWGLAPKTVDKICMWHSNALYACNTSFQDLWWIVGNNLSGLISSSITDLSNISQVTLARNTKVTWLLPNIGQLSKLQVRSTDSNTLTWSINTSVFSLTGLRILNLSGNNLSGILPTTSTTTLTQLILSNNRLSWTIPAWIGTKTWLIYLGLDNNAFTSTIPAFGLTSLQLLHLGNNTWLIVSVIPSWIASNTWLVSLTINNSNLTGTLPSSWSSLNKLTNLRLDNNNLQGEIPSSWSSLNKLTNITLANNNIDGVIPTWLPTSYTWLVNNGSTINNNCMYTGFVTGTFLTYMNTEFGSNWQAQKICATDPMLVWATTVWSLQTANSVTYTVNYRNNGPRWLYLPRITVNLFPWLAIGNFTGTVVSSLPPLAPGQSGYVAYTINKNYFTQTGLVSYTNTYTISDATISDTNTGNNTLTQVGIARGSQYEVCRNSALTITQWECESLMDFYTANNGSSWTNKSNWWINPDVSTWFGVTTNGSSVTKLNLSNSTDKTLSCDTMSAGNNVSGVLTSSIWWLTNLTELCLGNNNLTGQLPASLTSLTWLVTLSLHRNTISSVATMLTAMPLLEKLDLSYNQLSWSISSITDTLAQLKQLWYNNNQLSTWLSYLSKYNKLQSIRLQNNILLWSVPPSWSSMTFVTELNIQNNRLDRDEGNSAIIPSSLVSRYNSITTRYRDNQWDVISPSISNLGSVSGTINAIGFPITFTINENSYASWLYTSWSLSGQILSWLYISVIGSSLCTTISSDPITNHTGVVSVMIYPETNGTYAGCTFTIRDRANNASNSIVIPTFTYTQPPYRLHLMMWGSGAVVNSGWSLQQIRDLSPFGHTITMAWGNPVYIPTIANNNPAIQFNAGQSLMTPGIFRKQRFDNVHIFMAVKPWANSSNLLFEQSNTGFPISLTNTSWTVWLSNVSYILPPDQVSLVTASHMIGLNHAIKIDGTMKATVTPNQPLQLTGISVTKIGEGITNGYLAEVLVYTDFMDIPSINYIESYLAIKYGVTLLWDYTAMLSNNTVGTIWPNNIAYNKSIVALGRYNKGPLPLDQQTSTAASGSTITLHTRGTWTDGQYVVVGSNAGALTWTKNIPWFTWYKAVERTWYVKKTWSNPLFDISVTDTSIAPFNFAPTIIVSSSATFNIITSSWVLVKSGTKRISSWVTINDGQYVTFAIAQSSMGGRVWLDLNRDGIQSPSEPSVAWVKVRLRQCPTPTQAYTQAWYLSSSQTSPWPMLAEYTTTTWLTNYLFSSINPGNYYVTYDRSTAQVVSPLSLTWTKNAAKSPWIYEGWVLWSDYEQHRGWNNNKSSSWYGIMSSLSGIALSDIDSDMMSPDFGGAFLAQSSKCYTLDAGTNQTKIWAWLMRTTSTDLSLTQSLSTNQIANTSWALSTFNLTLTAANNGPKEAYYTQIVTELSPYVTVDSIQINGQSTWYILSGSQLKIYLGVMNPSTTQVYTVSLRYNWLADDDNMLMFSSKIMSTTLETSTSNNTPPNTSLTLTKYGASVWNTVWIDGNRNGIQDDGTVTNLSWIVIELRRASDNTLVKTPKTSTSNGSYVFTSIDPWQYYIFVTNLPKWYIFTNTGGQGINSTNDSNINPSTNQSSVFTIANGIDDLTIDIWLVPLDPLTQCSTVQQHKLRLGQSYTNFIDVYVTNIAWVRLFRVERVWTETADYNNSTSLPTMNINNNGYRPWSPLRWYIRPSTTQRVVWSSGDPYTPVTAPAQRGTTGQMIVSYNYEWCLVNDAIPSYCLQAMRYNSCHTYEISSCGDGIKDQYDNTYLWQYWIPEQCDNGSQNNGVDVVNGVKCNSDCTINNQNIADLAVDKTDNLRNICALPSGSDGSLWSSGSIASSSATLITGSVTTWLVISN